MTEQPQYIPVRLYISKQKYRQLKSKLALEGMTLSEWFRRKADEELER